MNTDIIAMYVGYIILGILALALIVYSAWFVFNLIIAVFQVFDQRKTIWFLRKAVARGMADSAQAAFDVIMSHKFTENHTLGEVKRQIELYRKINKI